MIKVTYMPAYERSPLPEDAREYIFLTFQEFKEWVQNYVCTSCLLDFYDMNGEDPSDLGDWLDMGCGCEIEIDEGEYPIDWHSPMELPENFEELKNKFLDEKEE